jgi:zinc finger protein CreA/MIG
MSHLSHLSYHALNVAQGESYARPTSVMSHETPLSRRSQSGSALSTLHSGFAPRQPDVVPASATAFTTLSSLAMEELYVLERQEALRRAEYEAKHADALRRAEYEARLGPQTSQSWARISKSATTSPILSSHQALPVDGGRSGFPHQRASFDVRPQAGGDYNAYGAEVVTKAQRRLSGPAWSVSAFQEGPSYSGPHSSSSTHFVDHPGTRGLGLHHHGSHPYQAAHHHRHRNSGSGGTHNSRGGSPSPMSSDEESPPLQMHTKNSTRSYGSNGHGTHHYHHRQSIPPTSQHHSPVFPTGRSSEFTFTPSTSPFLGPLRTLNIQSTNPSRAPSPVLLPPPQITPPAEDSSHSPTSSYPRHNGISTSPPSSSALGLWGGRGQHHSRRSDSGNFSFGVNSGSSSPSSGGFAFHHSRLSGPASNASSRPPSPSNSHHATNPHHNHHNHLAHSVRLAFGMTPIHPTHSSSSSSSAPRSPPRSSGYISPNNGLSPGYAHPTSVPHSSTGTPMAFSSLPMSMPGSRAGSPPIKLPPLKISDSSEKIKKEELSGVESGELVNGAGQPTVGEKGKEEERVELPGFSQFAAVARGTARF